MRVGGLTDIQFFLKAAFLGRQKGHLAHGIFSDEVTWNTGILMDKESTSSELRSLCSHLLLTFLILFVCLQSKGRALPFPFSMGVL